MSSVKYIIIFVYIITTFCIAVLSCLVVSNFIFQRKNKDTLKSVIEKKESIFNIAKNSIRHIMVKQLIVATICTVLTSFACFRAQIFGVNIIQTIKAVICCEIVMSAAIIDLFTKKIPNKLNLVLYIAGVVLLASEFFFNRESFPLRLTASLTGFGIGFGFLLVMSLITKGGMGMGDVKLIGGVGLIFGIASVIYSITYSMIICLFAAIIMLVTGRKKIKDKVPFCPFFFLGLIISVSIGTF